ncbi:2OG-Fe(II) oxygenase family protein [Maribius pontilimi]|uniref:2OG-Fe(II) oxygenase family protein n=1 Tax=Palleronia pontilimi TaxID=1964209 RepID=A0A934IFT9_9RHOB|nr:TIGR02466 family protein [Palleronia pontilimi]MBJ3762103.1 2OG-Fe(II) oxygenase family protein [Palleronia pontilimi]
MGSIERTKYEKLFSTPLFRFRVPDAEALNRDLLETGSRLRSETDGVKKSNRGGWHSSGNLFDDAAPDVQKLKALAEKAVLDATGQVTAKVDPGSLGLKLFAWMNANPPGGFNAPHTHPGAQWSGVYYVSQPSVEEGTSGKIEFLSPRADLPNWRILQAQAFGSKKSIRPEPGELILFPSYLVHWVYPNETDDERVTVAFNATFRQKK